MNMKTQSEFLRDREKEAKRAELFREFAKGCRVMESPFANAGYSHAPTQSQADATAVKK